MLDDIGMDWAEEMEKGVFLLLGGRTTTSVHALKHTGSASSGKRKEQFTTLEGEAKTKLVIFVMIPNTASIVNSLPLSPLCFGWKSVKSATSGHSPPTDFHFKMHVATETRCHGNRSRD